MTDEIKNTEEPKIIAFEKEKEPVVEKTQTTEAEGASTSQEPQPDKEKTIDLTTLIKSLLNEEEVKEGMIKCGVVPLPSQLGRYTVAIEIDAKDFDERSAKSPKTAVVSLGAIIYASIEALKMMKQQVLPVKKQIIIPR